MCCPSPPAGHVVSSSQWAVSRRDLCPSSQSISEPRDPLAPLSLLRQSGSPMLKQQNHKNHSSLTLSHCMQNSYPGVEPMHTDIYVNKKSMEISGLICYCNIAHYLVSYRKSEQKEALYPVINQFQTFTRMN